MKLNKRQFCIAVDTFKTMLEEERQIIDVLDIGPEWKGGDWIQNYYELLTDLCEFEEDPIYGNDLNWFCFDTDFGRKEDYCKVFDNETGRTWTIRDPEILYDFITRDE